MKVAEHEQEHQKIGLKPTGKEKIQAQSTPREHHPGNPETVHYDFPCARCQQPIKRVASHQGGVEFNPEPVNGEWVKHPTTCKGVPPKPAEELKPELSPSERLAAGEKLAPEPTLLQKIENVVEKVEEKIEEVVEGKPEPDVIAELEKAPPAPVETENKPKDAA